MAIIKVLKIPTMLPKHCLPTHIVKHCNIYKEAAINHASKFAWITLSKYIDLSKVKFSKNGKPYLIGNKQYFSLSHTHDMIAIAINDKPIGIDIEYILPTNIASMLASRLLEGKQLQSYYKAKDRAIWFTKYWTQHEAYIKLIDGMFNFNSLKLKLNCSIKTKQIKNRDKVLIVSIISK